jgi:hypothetical protein
MIADDLLSVAKDLLSVRLIGDNHKANRKRELQRLQKLFRDESVKLLVHHPTHGYVASCDLPILPGADHKRFLEHYHDMTIHKELSARIYKFRCSDAIAA